MADCEHCRARLLPGQKVCKACGEPVLAEEDDPTAPDRMVGRTIASNYEILEHIGEGAMGRVYRSRQVSLDKEVAIKVLHRHLASDPKVVRRFHREARAASRLSHPNSLQIIDFGEDTDGTLYIAMEYLDGDDLLTVIEHDSPLTPRRILALLRQVLAALDAAHHAGIIHRDLKPENVVVLEEPSGKELVKVCDFGIAKIQEVEGGSAITVSGFVCGTPEYMAPEQARGEELDKRADIYAAGCMLFQMLTAELPFRAESALGIITKHLTEDAPRPSLRKPALRISPLLDEVCLRAMKKERDARYPDATSMLAALEEAVASLGADAELPLGKGRSEPTLRVTSERSDAGEPQGGKTLWAAGLIAVGAVAVAIALLSGEGADSEARLPPETARAGPIDGASDDAGPTLRPLGADGGGEPGPAEADAGVAPPTRDAGRRGGGTKRRHPAQTGGETPEGPTGAPSEDPYDVGRRLFLANDVQGAIRAFEQASRATPRNAEIHKQLGRAYMRAGDVGRAAASYRRYLELAPNAPDRAIVERIIERDVP